MTQEIIEMAREAGLEVDGVYFSDTMYRAVLVRFANLVAAKEQKKWQDQTAVEIYESVLEEREACARVAEPNFGVIGSTIALAIRARGEQT
jgi:enoyl reductase-like protein